MLFKINYSNMFFETHNIKYCYVYLKRESYNFIVFSISSYGIRGEVTTLMAAMYKFS